MDFLVKNYLNNHIVVWTAHLRELLLQAQETISQLNPSIPVLWWDAKNKPKKLPNSCLLLTMIQSTRTFDTALPNSILVIDECHKEAAKSYKNFEFVLSPKLKIGLSATPFRLDRKVLGFDKISYSTSLLDLASQGFLAKPKYTRVCTDLRFNLDIAGGEFTGASLERLNSKDRHKLIVDYYLSNPIVGTIVFMPSVKSGKALNDLFLSKGIKSAVVTGSSSKPIRDLCLSDFNKRKIHVLINVNLYTHGLAADIRQVFLARPTLSKSLWLQMVGRGAAFKEDKKEYHVIDFIDNVDKYPLIAQIWSNKLLAVPLSPEVKKQVECSEKTKEFIGKAKSKKHKDILLKVAKIDKILDLVGILSIKNNFTSATKEIPVFKQDLPIFQTFKALLFASDAKFDFIESSYTRGGYKTTLSFKDWNAYAWASFFTYLKNKPLLSFSKYVEFDLPNIDLSLFDMSDPSLDAKFFSGVFKKLPAWINKKNTSLKKIIHKTVIVKSSLFSNQIGTLVLEACREVFNDQDICVKVVNK